MSEFELNAMAPTTDSHVSLKVTLLKGHIHLAVIVLVFEPKYCANELILRGHLFKVANFHVDLLH